MSGYFDWIADVKTVKKLQKLMEIGTGVLHAKDLDADDLIGTFTATNAEPGDIGFSVSSPLATGQTYSLNSINGSYSGIVLSCGVKGSDGVTAVDATVTLQLSGSRIAVTCTCNGSPVGAANLSVTINGGIQWQAMIPNGERNPMGIYTLELNGVSSPPLINTDPDQGGGMQYPFVRVGGSDLASYLLSGKGVSVSTRHNEMASALAAICCKCATPGATLAGPAFNAAVAQQNADENPTNSALAEAAALASQALVSAASAYTSGSATGGVDSVSGGSGGPSLSWDGADFRVETFEFTKEEPYGSNLKKLCDAGGNSFFIGPDGGVHVQKVEQSGGGAAAKITKWHRRTRASQMWNRVCMRKTSKLKYSYTFPSKKAGMTSGDMSSGGGLLNMSIANIGTSEIAYAAGYTAVSGGQLCAYEAMSPTGRSLPPPTVTGAGLPAMSIVFCVVAPSAMGGVTAINTPINANLFVAGSPGGNPFGYEGPTEVVFPLPGVMDTAKLREKWLPLTGPYWPSRAFMLSRAPYILQNANQCLDVIDAEVLIDGSIWVGQTLGGSEVPAGKIVHTEWSVSPTGASMSVQAIATGA